MSDNKHRPETNMTKEELNSLGQIISESINANNAQHAKDLSEVQTEIKTIAHSVNKLTNVFTEYVTRNEYMQKELESQKENVSALKQDISEIKQTLTTMRTEQEVKSRLWKGFSDNWYKVFTVIVLISAFTGGLYYTVQSVSQAPTKVQNNERNN